MGSNSLLHYIYFPLLACAQMLPLYNEYSCGAHLFAYCLGGIFGEEKIGAFA